MAQRGNATENLDAQAAAREDTEIMAIANFTPGEITAPVKPFELEDIVCIQGLTEKNADLEWRLGSVRVLPSDANARVGVTLLVDGSEPARVLSLQPKNVFVLDHPITTRMLAELHGHRTPDVDIRRVCEMFKVRHPDDPPPPAPPTTPPPTPTSCR